MDITRAALKLLLGFLIVTSALCRGSGTSVTTGSLFEEMAALDILARFPDPPYRTVQFSSFDRRSRTPAGPGWFANADGFGGEPIPNFEATLKAPKGGGSGEYLMADVPGPGAIVRLWTAAISGRVRLYLDDMERPLYEGEAEPFFRRPYDAFQEIRAIDRERFGRTVYQRDASYAPIPFARRLRLVWTGKLDEIHFYHIQVRQVRSGTPVETFRPDDISAFKDTIDRSHPGPGRSGCAIRLAVGEARPGPGRLSRTGGKEGGAKARRTGGARGILAPRGGGQPGRRLEADRSAHHVRRFSAGPGPVSGRRFLRRRPRRQSLQLPSLFRPGRRPDDLPVRHAVRRIPPPGFREPRRADRPAEPARPCLGISPGTSGRCTSGLAGG